MNFYSLFLPMVVCSAVFAVDISTSTPTMLAPITITASPAPKSILDTPASVTVLEGRALDKERSESVMGAIQNEPGVNMIGEGPTVVKPVIRGLNSQDIVVVEDGVRSEALQWGSEHAPEIDPLGADRIEVMRGPNSLLYGSDALGGVIAINHPALPNAHQGDGPLQGRLVSGFNSNNNAFGENIEAAGAAGDWGYRANVSQLQAGNFRNPQGEVSNTGLNEVSGSGAMGVRKDWGMLDLDFGKFNKRVELQNPSQPYPAPFDDLEYQTLQHEHGKIHATLLSAPANFDITLGYDRANRKEFDSPSAPEAPPTLNWIESSYSLDAKARLAPLGPFQGTLGFSGLRRAEASLGVTHLTPGYHENGFGEYLVEEIPVGKFDFTLGVRGDQDRYAIAGDDHVGADNAVDGVPHPVNRQTLQYNALSAAAGGVYHITDPLAFAVNLGRGYRNPIPFELFAFGEHEGAGVFQIGNPTLAPETSFNSDASLRWASPRVKAEVGVFRNEIHHYIYGSYTGNVTGDGLPIVQETQANAIISGVDGALSWAAARWLTLRTVYNLVHGYNDSGDPTLPSDYLPHVPADNVLLGAELHGKSLGFIANPYFSAEEKFTAAHSRVGPEEIPTPGYALTDLRAGGEFIVMNNRITLDVGVQNLFNKGYIDFNSILKESNIEDAGRNVVATLSIPFGN